MNFTKEHKWIIASHLQKAIRYGLTKETLWALSHLYDVDRAYMAYRLSVMIFEDVLSGNAHLSHLIMDNKWGAKKFNDKKSEEDKKLWQKVALELCNSVKDRTPCKWSSCTRWLNEFELTEGKWEAIEPYYAIECAMSNDDKPWWWKGLMAWRAAGSYKFPNTFLPKNIQGDFDAWTEEAQNDDLKSMLSFLGNKQIEPHVIFIPLCLDTQKKDKEIKIKKSHMKYEIYSDFLLPSIDKHTKEGKEAIRYFYENYLSQEEKQVLLKKVGQRHIVNFIGQLMFFIEGDKLDKKLNYTTSDKIDLDIKKAWLKSYNINGRWVFEHLAKPKLWNESRKKILQKEFNLNNKIDYKQYFII